MNEQAQRIAIAEECGFSSVSEDELESVDIDAREVSTWTAWMGTRNGLRVCVPDYLNDLNACLPLLGTDWDCRTRNDVNFITIYRPSEQHEAFGENLCHVICEAFLRTIGKWVDSAPAQKP